MSDLTNKEHPSPEPGSETRSQADVERLTAELADANKDADYYHQMWQEDGERIDEAEAERDRLSADEKEACQARDAAYKLCDEYVAERDRLRAAQQWAIQELRRCDNAGYANHIADTLAGAPDTSE